MLKLAEARAGPRRALIGISWTRVVIRRRITKFATVTSSEAIPLIGYAIVELKCVVPVQCHSIIHNAGNCCEYLDTVTNMRKVIAIVIALVFSLLWNIYG